MMMGATSKHAIIMTTTTQVHGTPTRIWKSGQADCVCLDIETAKHHEDAELFIPAADIPLLIAKLQEAMRLPVSPASQNNFVKVR